MSTTALDARDHPWYLAPDADGWHVHGKGYYVLTGFESDPPIAFATEADALAFALALGLSPAARMANVAHPAVGE